MKPAEFTDANYTIIVEFTNKFGIKKFVSLLNQWQGNRESEEDFIYSLCERLMTD